MKTKKKERDPEGHLRIVLFIFFLSFFKISPRGEKKKKTQGREGGS